MSTDKSDDTSVYRRQILMGGGTYRCVRVDEAAAGDGERARAPQHEDAAVKLPGVEMNDPWTECTILHHVKQSRDA